MGYQLNTPPSPAPGRRCSGNTEPEQSGCFYRYACHGLNVTEKGTPQNGEDAEPQKSLVWSVYQREGSAVSPHPGNGNSVMTGPRCGGWKLGTDRSHPKQKHDVVTGRVMNHNELSAGGGEIPPR